MSEPAGAPSPVSWTWAGPFLAGICLALIAVVYASVKSDQAIIAEALKRVETVQIGDHTKLEVHDFQLMRLGELETAVERSNKLTEQLTVSWKAAFEEPARHLKTRQFDR